ncbi:hypothetical protein BCR39DRAFT_541526 [Naematelia encephala]|uniref:Protein kinase domain-containing protein n=1 Tax=Naematelia encephala TaxID=71784 RepID=A0A1Y2AUI5_9TREE|nr:hypothetical protein BCR39DRAFT_541526 [Naematelia encephala]
MNHHLARTRSRHFVSSPRRVASPLKHKHSSIPRLPLKRRRLGTSTTFAASKVTDVDVDDEDEDIAETEMLNISAGRRRVALSAETGASNANRSKAKRRDPGPSRLGGRDVEDEDVFLSTDDEASPRKRKRSHPDSGSASAAETGSWVEVDDGDEDEPEFIAESDQHLLEEAPAYALHRLRKAELVRLWKVGGMWSIDDDDQQVEESIAEEEDGGLSKKELVDGLIASRKHSIDHKVSPHPSPRNSPRRKATLESAFEIDRLRSASGSVPLSTGDSSPSSDEHSRARVDTDATPRAPPRTRSKSTVKNRLSEAALLRSAHRRVREKPKGRPNGHVVRPGFRGDERKARFGDEVKSPANGLLRARRGSRSSVGSSAYTTTDTSPPTTSPVIRQTPRRRRQSASERQASLARKTRKAKLDHNGGDEEDDEAHSDEVDPTPLVRRLRSRGNLSSSFVKDTESELEADGEEEDEEDEEDEVDESQASPQSRSNRRVPSGKPLINRPERGAKKKAIEALKNGESDDDDIEDNEMDIDESASFSAIAAGLEDEDEEMEEPSRPSSGPLTRSQHRSQGSPELEALQPEPRRLTRRASQMSTDDSTTSSSSLSPLSEDATEDMTARTTRSGKAFGVWQSRKRRLRQEAIDDPDMEVDDEDDIEEDDENETDDDSFEFDVDLADATVASLTRLLRDELVQLCETRGIEVGGTKPQLARALIEWRDEQQGDAHSATSSQATARPSSSRKKTRRKIIHAIASNKHVSGKTTPVLLRDHFHVKDPETPPHSDESKPSGEAELNLDLSELGLEDSMIKPEQLVKLEKIGSGGFKDVYVGKLRGRKVAISEFRGHLSEMDIRELKLLAEFSHPNIVRFRGICIPEDASQIPCMLVSELCENGDLFDYIRNVPPQPLRRVLGLMLDIARGLEYLHTRKPAIIHRDCKSSNILINRAGVAKVGDFGLARVKTSTRSMIRSLVGTVNWQAPELWHPQPRYDYKVDVFSAACVYWEMLAGWGVGDKKYPWEGHNEHYIYDAVGAKQRRPFIVGLRKAWGAEPVNLMERMWHQDPGERPTMTDVVADLEAMIAEL